MVSDVAVLAYAFTFLVYWLPLSYPVEFGYVAIIFVELQDRLKVGSLLVYYCIIVCLG